MMILLIKNANIWGKRWEKRGKEEIFTVLGGKNMIFKKKGGGKNINYFENIHP